MLTNESAGAEKSSDSAGADSEQDIDFQVNDDGSVDLFDAGAPEEAQSTEEQPDENGELDSRTQGILDSGRTRIKNLPEADRLLVAYASAHNISLSDAQSQLGGNQQQAQAETVQDAPASSAEQAIEGINTQITDIDKQISELRAEGELEQADALLQKRFDLQEQRINAQMDIREAQQTATAEEQQQFTRSWDSAADKALDLYPDLSDENSELFNLVQDKYDALKAANDPSLQNADWPFQAAAVAAAELGLASTNAQPATQPDNPFGNRRRPTNATPTSGSRTANSGPPMGMPGAVDLSRMSADQGMELLKKIGRGLHEE
jgi:hypothetical protein